MHQEILKFTNDQFGSKYHIPMGRESGWD
jgi:hypothetical protein